MSQLPCVPGTVHAMPLHALVKTDPNTRPAMLPSFAKRRSAKPTAHLRSVQFDRAWWTGEQHAFSQSVFADGEPR